MYAKKKPEKKQGCYITTAIGAFVIVLIVEWLWPKAIPFTFWQFWKLDGSILDVLKASWPVLMWGVGITTIYAILTHNRPEINRNAEAILAVGGFVSLWAGIVEEIAFRWLIFYSAVIGAKVSNFLFFGFLGFGIPEWFYTHVAGPVANWLTLGMLEPILFGSFGWAVGAAVISSNGKFRDGHIYQGLLGWINSWFIGMFMFYLMFQYGLVASIIVHTFYDLFITVIRYIDAVVERVLGWA